MLVGKRFIFLIFAVAILLSLVTSSADTLANPTRIELGLENEDLVLENQFIRILQNTRLDAEGRFTLLAKTNGRFNELLYGRSAPWTSYTTVRIDGTNYVFGGPTNRRAGVSGNYGTIEWSGFDENGNLVTVVRFDDSIRVIQRLSLVLGLTTGLESSMAVQYQIENLGDSPREVGLRVVLDTKLGRNDGAPIRFGNQVVTTDTVLSASAIPVFWQAFDDLGETAVVAEAVLQGPGLTPPDKMVITNWGSLADHLWDIPVIDGRDFSREGEWYDLDSAVALFWDPVTLYPRVSHTYVTQYGVGELSGVRGELTVGFASPAKVREKEPFPIMAYIEGTLGMSSDVVATLSLPDGWRLIRGTPTVRLGDIPYADVKQAEWMVQATGASGSGDIQLVVASANGVPIHTRRTIDVERHDLEIRFGDLLQAPHNKGHLSAFLLEAEVINRGTVPAPPTVVELVLDGARLSDFDTPTRILPLLEAGQRATLSWAVLPVDSSTTVLASVTVHGERAFGESVEIQLPTFVPTIEVYQEGMSREEWTKLQLYAYEFPRFHEILVDVSYSGNLDIAHVSKGELMVIGESVTGELSYRHDRARNHLQIVVRGEGLVEGTGPLLSITTVGEGHVSIDRFQVYTTQGQMGSIPFPIRSVKVQ